MKNFSKLAVVAAFAAVASVPAHAALDAAVSTAITGAGTDLGLLYTALTTAGAALFIARLIYRHFTIR